MLRTVKGKTNQLQMQRVATDTKQTFLSRGRDILQTTKGRPLSIFAVFCIIVFQWWRQARNQLGTPGGAKSFPRGAQILWTMYNILKLCPTHFSRGDQKFSRGAAPPGYRPECRRRHRRTRQGVGARGRPTWLEKFQGKCKLLKTHE